MLKSQPYSRNDSANDPNDVIDNPDVRFRSYQNQKVILYSKDSQYDYLHYIIN